MANLESLGHAPNTLREYETIYILKPDTVNDKVAEVNDRVKGIIESRGGIILDVDNWGKRKLAYEIKKQLKGIYLYWKYLGTPDVIDEFERNMRMLDAVIRYQTVKLEKDISPTDRESAVNDETYEKAATTAADEEELMMGRVDDPSRYAMGSDDDSGDGDPDLYSDDDAAADDDDRVAVDSDATDDEDDDFDRSRDREGEE